MERTGKAITKDSKRKALPSLRIPPRQIESRQKTRAGHLEELNSPIPEPPQTAKPTKPTIHIASLDMFDGHFEDPLPSGRPTTSQSRRRPKYSDNHNEDSYSQSRRGPSYSNNLSSENESIRPSRMHEINSRSERH